MIDFSLILPTHNHPALLKRLFESIALTAANLDRIEVVLYLDNGDILSQKISHPFIRLVKLIKQPDTMGNMLRQAYLASQAERIMLINDDMLFRTKGWDIEVQKTFSLFTDEVGMVYGNDFYYGNLMCTFPILSRKACELMGGICPAQYKWHCIDAHIFDIFKRLSGMGHKRSVYLGNVIFEHMHHELSAAINDSELEPRSDVDDQELYFSLAQERQQVALRLAEYIEKGQAQELTASIDKTRGHPFSSKNI